MLSGKFFMFITANTAERPPPTESFKICWPDHRPGKPPTCLWKQYQGTIAVASATKLTGPWCVAMAAASQCMQSQMCWHALQENAATGRSWYCEPHHPPPLLQEVRAWSLHGSLHAAKHSLFKKASLRFHLCSQVGAESARGDQQPAHCMHACVPQLTFHLPQLSSASGMCHVSCVLCVVCVVCACCYVCPGSCLGAREHAPGLEQHSAWATFWILREGAAVGGAPWRRAMNAHAVVSW